jgi:hypothetical protein
MGPLIGNVGKYLVDKHERDEPQGSQLLFKPEGVIFRGFQAQRESK